MERDEVLKIFSENLRAERARKKYSQNQLAEKANITQESLYRIENQKMNPTILIVANLALALDVAIDTLMPLNKKTN